MMTRNELLKLIQNRFDVYKPYAEALIDYLIQEKVLQLKEEIKEGIYLDKCGPNAVYKYEKDHLYFWAYSKMRWEISVYDTAIPEMTRIGDLLGQIGPL